ncbi:MAG: protein translocase subunit SecD [Legionellales bacterium]|nr:protein translocase subunit SecD [Legionellales bacterium]
MIKVNRFKLYGYLFITLVAVVYSLPNFYGESPAIQLNTPNKMNLTALKEDLSKLNISPVSIEEQEQSWLLKFDNTEAQLQSLKTLTSAHPNWITALNLANNTPQWLMNLGAVPMKLGLDLRGGVHFLLNVDTVPAITLRVNADIKDMHTEIRKDHIKNIRIKNKNNQIIINGDRGLANINHLILKFSDYTIVSQDDNQIRLALSPSAQNKLIQYTIDQTIQILNNRVNELGVSEALVQQQGDTMISVDLPGIQDTAKAKDLLGSNATISFQLVVPESRGSHIRPIGTKFYDYNQRKVLLSETPILTGSSITFAISNISDNGHAVQIRLGGGGETRFYRATAENVGEQLAVVYSEKKMSFNQQTQKKGWRVDTKVISVATINQALGNSFEINNLESAVYAEKLALLLRSGALTAPFEIVEETLIGPSMGQENIFKGMLSLAIGFILVNLFMLMYYRTFGLVADLALLLNLLFLMAMLSVLGNTLTLPGIAGIVLTVGMAVDANVLINERIREELKRGITLINSIDAGYNKAFATIVDANVTTLIVAFILFGLGSGTIKGFAITLILGLISSMVTSIYITRAIIEWLVTRFETINIGLK